MGELYSARREDCLDCSVKVERIEFIPGLGRDCLVLKVRDEGLHGSQVLLAQRTFESHRPCFHHERLVSKYGVEGRP